MGDAVGTGLAAYVDQYCERTAPGLAGEPINALSNLGFLLAACAIWRLAGRVPRLSAPVRVLAALAAAVGAGSTAFHVTAQAWARILDIGFIVLFELAFFWQYLRRGVRLAAGPSAATLAVFATVVALTFQVPDVLRGSVPYFPALAAVSALGLLHRSRYGGSLDLLAAAVLLGVALVFRTIDQPACAWWPAGTHFVWHLLNAGVMVLSVRALSRTVDT